MSEYTTVPQYLIKYSLLSPVSGDIDIKYSLVEYAYAFAEGVRRVVTRDLLLKLFSPNEC